MTMSTGTIMAMGTITMAADVITTDRPSADAAKLVSRRRRAGPGRGGMKTEFLERDMVSGLKNGLDVIEAFDDRRPRLSLTDVAQITGLSRAAARRYLLTLTRLGYAEHDGKFFSLTPKILRLGYAYLSSTSLPVRIQPFLERVSETTGESSSAAVLDDTDVVYIARSATRRIMSIGLGIGSRLPAFCTSLGRAILAWKDPAWLDAYFRRVPLEARTPWTLTEEAAVRAALEEVRRRGYALVDEELELGLRSMAVPVQNAKGEVVCAINISIQASRMTADELVASALPVLTSVHGELRRLV
ncbi:MAG: IclR family transcriptional regulator C-terminal domain-containing protein [Rhodospirillales bacterium]